MKFSKLGLSLLTIFLMHVGLIGHEMARAESDIGSLISSLVQDSDLASGGAQEHIDKPTWLYRLNFKGRCSYALGYIHRGLNTNDLHPLARNRMNYAQSFFIELNDWDMQRLASDASQASTPLIERFLEGQAKELEEDLRAEFANIANRLNLSRTGDQEANIRQLNNLEPFLAFSMLMGKLMYPEDSSSFDQQVFSLAHSLGRPIYSLDRRSVQRELLEEIYSIDELRLLAFNLGSTATSGHEALFISHKRRPLENLINAYLEGNISQLVNALETAPHSEMKSNLHTSRNRDWANRIYDELLLQDRRDFNIFLGGVSHFIGDQSVLVYLQSRGIEVTMIREKQAQKIMDALPSINDAEGASEAGYQRQLSDPCLNDHF